LKPVGLSHLSSQGGAAERSTRASTRHLAFPRFCRLRTRIRPTRAAFFLPSTISYRLTEAALLLAPAAATPRSTLTFALSLDSRLSLRFQLDQQQQPGQQGRSKCPSLSTHSLLLQEVHPSSLPPLCTLSLPTTRSRSQPTFVAPRSEQRLPPRVTPVTAQRLY